MATNRDLLKEAIADAKAVKETAIANAKAALEEAFTPQLQSMFAAKLQEMEKEEELEEAGFGKMNADSDEGFSSMGEKALDEAEDEMYEAEDKDMNEIDLEELLAELNEEEEEMEESLNEAEEEEEEDVEMSDEESEEGEEEGEPLDLEDMTDEDLKDIIEDVIKDMIASGELEAGHEGEEGEEEEEVGMEDEEEVDLAELLKEIEEMESNQVEEGFIDTVKKAAQNLLKGSEQKWLEKQIESGKYNDELAAIEAAEDVNAKRAAARPIINDFLKFNEKAIAGAANPGGYRNEIVKELERVLGYGEGFKSSFTAAQKATQGLEETMKDELAEAMKTIEALKSELNEINLLNAKLLYTNKIFKSKNLNENQKVKVLSSFDKATTVGEVKMVFETLNEGIKVKKDTIKENLGRASKATITPVAKQPIVESNDAFLRMQKLAGIIK
jgi:hypothetical protein